MQLCTLVWVWGLTKVIQYTLMLWLTCLLRVCQWSHLRLLFWIHLCLQFQCLLTLLLISNDDVKFPKTLQMTHQCLNSFVLAISLPTHISCHKCLDRFSSCLASSNRCAFRFIPCLASSNRCALRLSLLHFVKVFEYGSLA